LKKGFCNISDYEFLATILAVYLATSLFIQIMYFWRPSWWHIWRLGDKFGYRRRIMPQRHQKLYSKFRVSQESTLKISSQ
jgi:hypothetical protein